MAIDTKNKRFSCVNIALPFGRILPYPDGNLNVMQDRQQMALLYRSFRSLLNLVKEIYFEVSI